MSFTRYMAVLNVVSQAETGLTAGQINKALPMLSVAQIKLTLRTLAGEGAVTERKFQYRPHIIATVYVLEKTTAQQCAGIARNYGEAMHQAIMPIANYRSA